MTFSELKERVVGHESEDVAESILETVGNIGTWELLEALKERKCENEDVGLDVPSFVNPQMYVEGDVYISLAGVTYAIATWELAKEFGLEMTAVGLIPTTTKSPVSQAPSSMIH